MYSVALLHTFCFFLLSRILHSLSRRYGSSCFRIYISFLSPSSHFQNISCWSNVFKILDFDCINPTKIRIILHWLQAKGNIIPDFRAKTRKALGPIQFGNTLLVKSFFESSTFVFCSTIAHLLFFSFFTDFAFFCHAGTVFHVFAFTFHFCHLLHIQAATFLLQIAIKNLPPPRVSPRNSAGDDFLVYSVCFSFTYHIIMCAL